MNGTVRQSKISFPEQYRPRIFLGYQKSQTLVDKVSERTQQCISGDDRKYVCGSQATGSLPQSNYTTEAIKATLLASQCFIKCNKRNKQ